MSRFQWSQSRRSYSYTSNAHVVTDAKLREWVSQAQQTASSELERIGQRLIKGQINRAQWAIESGQTIKSLHRSLAMLANGGRGMMTNREWGFVGGILRRELSHFNHFASEIDNTEISDLDSAFISRLRSYARAGHSTYENAVLARERFAPDTEWEQRHLGGSKQSCGDCIAEAGKGKQPTGTLKAIGEGCACSGGCHCYFTFGRSAAAVA